MKKNCKRCVLSKVVQLGVKTYQGALLASQPLEVLAIDFTLLEPATPQKGNMMVMTDSFSKYTTGASQKDQGRNFESALIWQLCQL